MGGMDPKASSESICQRPRDDGPLQGPTKFKRMLLRDTYVRYVTDGSNCQSIQVATTQIDLHGRIPFILAH
eukprot:2775011-Amphidinium_carterae.1